MILMENRRRSYFVSAPRAEVATFRYSSFLPLALNFILLLSMVNSMGVLAGRMVLSAGFSWRILYSVVGVRTVYSWQRRSVDSFLPCFLVPQSTEASET